MDKMVILASSDQGIGLGLRILEVFPKAGIFSTRNHPRALLIGSIAAFLEENFHRNGAIIFIGALGICVRSIAPHLEDKRTDPAVVNLDDTGRFVQAVLGGHMGGANALAEKLARALGSLPVITTASGNGGLWALDSLHRQFAWQLEYAGSLNAALSAFVNREPTAMLLETSDAGTGHLSKTCPDFVDIFRDYGQIDFSRYRLFLAVTPRLRHVPIPSLFYRPRVLSLGLGCEKNLETALFLPSLREEFIKLGLSMDSLKAFASLDLKQGEEAFLELKRNLGVPFKTYTPKEIHALGVLPNPSDTVHAEVGVYGVAEPAALLLSGQASLLVEKRKVRVESGKSYTMALAIESQAHSRSEGLVAIVGAGPGDPDLITIKGREFICEADLVLYAGSLIPEGLTSGAKPGATVRNSADMTLEEQLALMEEFYRQGKLIVRLQSGDPCLYGAIQEQMTYFDAKGMRYLIVPGISAFQAAAARLQSEFTIPEVVQTVILTRGKGNTPLPEREALVDLARAQATMCIFLSAHIAAQVQKDLLEHYPIDTPIAVCYRLTWQDERVWTGNLGELSGIIRDNKLKRTVLIIVGRAIGARRNRSRLYHPEWKHIFRPGRRLVKSISGEASA
jgi:precorrin-4 C11-methyltransferase